MFPRCLAFSLFLFLASSCTHSHDAGHHDQGRRGGVMHHDFSNAEKWSKVFDDPERDAWQKPQEVVALMDIKPGMWVADIGAGTGYFLPYLATATGGQGIVMGLDLPAQLISHMNERALLSKWRNVVAKQVSPDDPMLGAGTIDRILIVNTWHHIEDRESYARKLKDALKANGSVFVVDFEPTAKRGPKHHKLSKDQVIAELEAAGLKVSLKTETLEDQYVVVGTK